MINLFKKLPAFSADYSGVCNAVQHMHCLIVLHGQGGCIGGVNTCDDFEKERNEERILFTKISEIDTVTGNDKKLIDQIVSDSQEIENDFIIVAGSPIPMLIGTDWNAWVRELEAEMDKPVIAINTKGFATYEYGEKAIFLELVNKFACSVEKESRANIIGDTCLSGWTADMRRQLKVELQKKYNTVVSWNDDATLDDLRKMCSASLNIAASISALPAVIKMKKDYGIPYITIPELNEIKRVDKLTGASSILLVGEQIVMNQYREQIRRNNPDIQISVCNFFEMNPEWMEEGDCRLFGEDDYIKYLNEHGHCDCIVGDSLLEQFGGYEQKFIKYPQIALSGRLLNDR